MHKVYILDIEELKRSARQEVMLAGLNLERQKKVLRVKREEDRLRSLAAGLLLQYGLWKADTGIRGENRGTTCWEWIGVEQAEIEATAAAAASFCEKLTFLTGPAGKPYVQEFPVYFNLSHSGTKVICAICDKEVGVDIQQMRDGKLRGVWKRFFQEQEKNLLESLSSKEEQKKLFYQMWVCKEAYGKLTGGGLWMKQSDNTSVVSVSPMLDGEKLGIACILHTEIEGYMAAVCTEA